jgi:hypothetical protein
LLLFGKHLFIAANQSLPVMPGCSQLRLPGASWFCGIVFGQQEQAGGYRFIGEFVS